MLSLSVSADGAALPVRGLSAPILLVMQGAFDVPDWSKPASHAGALCNATGQNLTFDCPFGAATHNCSAALVVATPDGGNATLAPPYAPLACSGAPRVWRLRMVEKRLDPLRATRPRYRYVFTFECPDRAPACRYWSAAARAWSSEGCVVENWTRTNVTCACDHLTDFGAQVGVAARGVAAHVLFSS